MANEEEKKKGLQDLTDALADKAADENENTEYHRDKRAEAEQKIADAREAGDKKY